MKHKKSTGPDFVESLYLHAEVEMGFGLDQIPLSPSGQVSHSPGEPLARLEIKAKKCVSCPLYRNRTRLVFGAGNPRAELMFVGEAPGFDEDRVGFPFVGRAGRLLTRMIKAMGYTREEVYIANVLKCHPPNNRTPNPMEVETCRGFLEEQIRIISPRVIVALGAPAAKTLLQTEEGITSLRGRTFPYKNHPEITIVPTFHPAYLLRNESEKSKVWEDLKNAMALVRK